MWFPVTLWAMFSMSLLACSATASHNSFSDYEAAAPYKASSRSIAVDLNPWPESETYSRQLLGDRSADSGESLFNRGGDYPLDEEADSPSPDTSKMMKRDSHSLSIVNPLDVLRQRLMLEMARRRMKDTQDQIRENEVILKNLGKKRSEVRADRRKRNYLRRIHVSNSDNFEV